MEQLQKIVMRLPRKKGTEEEISSDIFIICHVACNKREIYTDIINSSLRGCFQKIGNIIFGIIEQWMIK